MKHDQRGSQPAAAEPRETHADVARITKDASPKDVEALMAEIADLRAKLDLSEERRDDAEKAALSAAEAQSAFLQQRAVQEVPTGKKKKVRRLDKYETVGYRDDGRPIVKPTFKTVEVPTYFYKIDIPPVGGIDCKINDVPMFHGVVYEVDIDALRTLKEHVYRLWDHERNISGSNENFYRTPEERQVGAARGR